jgi:hypothetical protein
MATPSHRSARRRSSVLSSVVNYIADTVPFLDFIAAEPPHSSPASVSPPESQNGTPSKDRGSGWAGRGAQTVGGKSRKRARERRASVRFMDENNSTRQVENWIGRTSPSDYMQQLSREEEDEAAEEEVDPKRAKLEPSPEEDPFPPSLSPEQLAALGMAASPEGASYAPESSPPGGAAPPLMGLSPNGNELSFEMQPSPTQEPLSAPAPVLSEVAADAAARAWGTGSTVSPAPGLVRQLTGGTALPEQEVAESAPFTPSSVLPTSFPLSQQQKEMPTSFPLVPPLQRQFTGGSAGDDMEVAEHEEAVARPTPIKSLTPVAVDHAGYGAGRIVRMLLSRFRHPGQRPRLDGPRVGEPGSKYRLLPEASSSFSIVRRIKSDSQVARSAVPPSLPLPRAPSPPPRPAHNQEASVQAPMVPSQEASTRAPTAPSQEYPREGAWAVPSTTPASSARPTRGRLAKPLSSLQPSFLHPFTPKSRKSLGAPPPAEAPLLLQEAVEEAPPVTEAAPQSASARHRRAAKKDIQRDILAVLQGAMAKKPIASFAFSEPEEHAQPIFGQAAPPAVIPFFFSPPRHV